MVKNISENRSPAKNIFKIILKAFLILLGLLVLLIVGVFATAPLFDKFDHDRFIALDTQIQSIFKELKVVSGGADDWKYEKVCSAEMAGDWQTGQFFCSAIISLDKTAKSVEDINSLQAKYYPVINNSSVLKGLTELTPELPNDFGKKFVVSSVEKHYKEVKSGIECNYSIQVGQSDKYINEITENYRYGKPIESGSGQIALIFKCSEKARSHWYSLDKLSS